MYAVVGTDGVVYGPVPVATLYEWIAQGRVVPGTTLIDWQGRHVAASMVPELQGAFPTQTQPYPVAGYGYPAAGYGFSTKRKSTALWLAFFLGPLGAHRFYLGHRASGAIMLVLNLAALGFITNPALAILLFLVTTLWYLVDMGLIASGALKAADGTPLG